MFKKQLTIFILTWLTLLLSCMTFLYYDWANAEVAYGSLMKDNSQMKKERSEDQEASSQQTRRQVSKQVIYTKGKDRLKIYLTGDESELIYLKKERELVERLKGVNCIIQDELIPLVIGDREETVSKETAKQMIRQLKAQEALYSYQKGKLEAKEMEIAHYLLPGFECPRSLEGIHPLFQGKAYRSQLSLFKEPSMQAQGFQAIFHDWENSW